MMMVLLIATMFTTSMNVDAKHLLIKKNAIKQRSLRQSVISKMKSCEYTGEYCESCYGCVTNAGWLTCECAFGIDENQSTSIALPCDGDIENDNGVLRCDSN